MFEIQIKEGNLYKNEIFYLYLINILFLKENLSPEHVYENREESEMLSEDGVRNEMDDFVDNDMLAFIKNKNNKPVNTPSERVAPIFGPIVKVDSTGQRIVYLMSLLKNAQRPYSGNFNNRCIAE